MSMNLEILLSSMASIIVSSATIIVFAKKIKNWLFQDIYKKLDEIEHIAKRNELITLFNSCPENVQAIEKAYDEYVEIKGNSYIINLHKEWLKKYAKDILAKSI